MAQHNKEMAALLDLSVEHNDEKMLAALKYYSSHTAQIEVGVNLLKIILVV